MPTVVATHIVIDADGRPWVEGTNTKVTEIVKDKLAHGWSPEEMHRQHPHLPLARIHAALSYYYDHQEEIDSQIEHEVAEVNRLRAAAGESPLARRLRERSTLVADAPFARP